MPARTVKPPTEARSGSKEGVVRYILALSLALVVAALVIAYMLA
jgi:hypothetical protein